MVTVCEKEYAPWGKCAYVTNGEAEFYATLDLGPRIIRAGLYGEPNFMFEDTGRTIKNNLSGKYADDTWYILGGHRLWASPEILPRTYVPENQPIGYTLLSDGVVLRPKNQPYAGIGYEITVTMAPDGEITLLHTMENISAWPIRFAPWALTVLAKGGKEIVPLPDRDTGLLHNRNLTLWPYTKMNDARVTWGDKFVTLRQDENADGNFKFGINSQHGWAAYFLAGNLFVKRFSPNQNGTYPDDGASFETYTCPAFLEMETLGELCEVAPGGKVSHTETWRFYKNVACPEDDEVQITKAMAPYIK